MLSFKPAFSHSSFTFIKRLFSSSSLFFFWLDYSHSSEVVVIIKVLIIEMNTWSKMILARYYAKSFTHIRSGGALLTILSGHHCFHSCFMDEVMETQRNEVIQ